MADDQSLSIPHRILRFSTSNATWILGTLSLIFLVSTISLAAVGQKQKILDNTTYVSPTDSPIEPSTPLSPTEPTTTVLPVCNDPPLADRFNCHPENNVSLDACEERGCCFNNVTDATNEVPVCYFPQNFEGYSMKVLSQSDYQILLSLKRQRRSGFPDDVENVMLNVEFVNDNLIRMKFTDTSARRWEVITPLSLSLNYTNSKNFLYDVSLSPTGLLKIVRKSTEVVLIQTDLRRLIYSNQFIQIDWSVPSEYIYGLSEHKVQLRQNVTWNKYTIFNRGGQPRDSCLKPGINMYGTHPMYMMVEDSKGNAHGVFLHNSNAIDVVLQPGSLTWRVIGGVLDFFVYLGPSPRDVVKQHASLIGKPFLPQYWTLGFHLSRYGYNSTNATVEAYDRTINASIPIDCQWNDIDVFDMRNDFTYDKENFSGLPEHVENLHNNNRKWVVILDPGVSNKENVSYKPYDEGKQLDIFVKDYQGKVLEGRVWNRNTSVFVDFTNPKAFAYWARQIDSFHKEVPFDALWVDMNEPTNFDDGSIHGCPIENPLESPPYVPGDDPLLTHTICMTAQQYLGVHYDVHSLYAHYETVATNYALAGLLKTRPFVLSRANFAGHGYFGAHWTGDIDSSWDHMKWSIVEIMEFNMYGLPMIGADICGFQHNATYDMCARWSALGAFYPFSRNHNDHDTIEQDPAKFGGAVESAARKALILRYTLLPYLYTLFYESHMLGEPVIRPLFFEFREDAHSYECESQFMWGSGLMIVPALTNETIIKAYFPPAIWYNFNTSKLITSKSEIMSISMELDEITLAIRGGNVIPTQDPALTTVESRRNPFRIIVALDAIGKAEGLLFWDDGSSINTITLGLNNLIHFNVENNMFLSKATFVGINEKMSLAEVRIFGIKSNPKQVLVNEKPIQSFIYDGASMLSVNTTELDLDLKLDINVTWKQ